VIVDDMTAINVDAGMVIADGQKKGREAESRLQ